MDRTTTEAELSFTHPIRQIVLMLVVVVLVALGAFVAWGQLSGVFLANIWLNGFIAMVFIFGILACFWQVLQLMQSVRWILWVYPPGSAGSAGSRAAPFGPACGLVAQPGRADADFGIVVAVHPRFRRNPH